MFMYYDVVWSRTERKLLEAALPLVARAGAHSMSFQDLADAVRIRKASVHYYFRTKSDLLIALIDGYDHVLTCQLGDILRSTSSGDNKLRLCISQLFSLVDLSDGTLICPCAMLSAEAVNLKPEVTDRLAKFFQDRAKVLATILEEGRQDGSLRFSGSAEPLAWMILSFVEGAMLVARATDGEQLFVEMRRALERQFVVPFAERPPGRNRHVDAEGPAENEGSVVFRHAPLADSNPETQPPSVEGAQPKDSPCAVVGLQELPASTSNTAPHAVKLTDGDGTCSNDIPMESHSGALSN